jgi:hypothetical protein
MSANVRCAGGGFPDDWAYVNDALAGTSKAKPCGWKGKRNGPDGWVTQEQSHTLSVVQLRQLRNDAVTAKPCPRCGGTVQLISEDQRTGGGR